MAQSIATAQAGATPRRPSGGAGAAEKALKHEYRNGKWHVKEVSVVVSPQPIAAGSNRLVYDMLDLSLPTGRGRKVAKAAREVEQTAQARAETFNEVVMQKRCQQLAKKFNETAPKKVRLRGGRMRVLCACCAQSLCRTVPNLHSSA